MNEQDYDEQDCDGRQRYTCFDVQYDATHQEANDLRSYLSSRPEAQEYEAVDQMITHGTFLAHKQLAYERLQYLAQRRAWLFDRLHGLTRLRAREMGLVS